jgi:hypothetical protein
LRRFVEAGECREDILVSDAWLFEVVTDLLHLQGSFLSRIAALALFLLHREEKYDVVTLHTVMLGDSKA